MTTGSGQVVRVMELGTQGAVALAYTPSGGVLASAAGDGVYLYDAGTLQEIGALPTGAAWSLAWAPEGHILAAGGEDGEVQFWRAADGARAGTLAGHSGAVRGVAWAPDGQTLASGSEDSIHGIISAR